MQKLKTVEHEGIRVLTSEQLSRAYETTTDTLKRNFNYNKKRFIQGKHFIKLEGEVLRQFKARYEIVTTLKYASILYLWTEKGALLHAKSLNTDKAWEVYDYLVDFYFRAQEGETVPAIKEAKPAEVEKVERQKLPQTDNPIRILKVLLQVADEAGIKVNSFPFGTVDSVLKGNHIGIRTGVTVEKACYELAWELAHAFIHYDNGDMIKSPLSKDYNEQATRAADMIIKILNVKMCQM